MKNIIFYFNLALSCFILSACATSSISFNVEALSDQTSVEENKHYILLSATPGISQTDLRFKRYSEYIHSALYDLGYRKAENPQTANIAIAVTYGSAATQRPNRLALALTALGHDLNDNTDQNTSNSEKLAQRELLEKDLNNVPQVTSFLRHLSLLAINLKSGKQEEVWEVNLISNTTTDVGTFDSLGGFFPFMVAAIKPYIGKDTNARNIQAILQIDSPDVHSVIAGEYHHKDKSCAEINRSLTASIDEFATLEKLIQLKNHDDGTFYKTLKSYYPDLKASGLKGYLNFVATEKNILSSLKVKKSC